MADGTVRRGLDWSSVDSVFRGLAMTIHAPTHREALHLSHTLHRFDRAMTTLACHAGGDVRTVVEIDVVRQVVNAYPGDRPGHRATARLEGFIQPTGIVELPQFRRDDWVRLSILHVRSLASRPAARQTSSLRFCGTSCRRRWTESRRDDSCPPPSGRIGSRSEVHQHATGANSRSVAWGNSLFRDPAAATSTSRRRVLQAEKSPISSRQVMIRCCMELLVH